MKLKVNRIIPSTTEPGPDVFDQLREEFRQHLARAQDLYEKALEAHDEVELPPAAGGEIQ